MIQANAQRGATAMASVLLLALAGCSSDRPVGEPSPPSSAPGTDRPGLTASPTPGPSQTPTPTRTRTAPVFDPDAAFATVDFLATSIGPREAASPAFEEAARYVRGRFERLGYTAATVPVPVPAGASWGVPVEAGSSANVMADPAGFDATESHVVIGAHLDTVAVAPGAEDNASGIGVLLELARMAAAQPPPVPLRLIAFGAEEPRGEGDNLHHFGSQQYVGGLSGAERSAVVAMVSLDRVGVPAGRVPACTGGTGTPAVRDALIAAGRAAGVAMIRCENRASDHWSFEKAGIPAARLGSVPYAGYHSPDDVPAVVDVRQLDRIGTVVWTWLRGLEG